MPALLTDPNAAKIAATPPARPGDLKPTNREQAALLLNPHAETDLAAASGSPTPAAATAASSSPSGTPPDPAGATPAAAGAADPQQSADAPALATSPTTNDPANPPAANTLPTAAPSPGTRLEPTRARPKSAKSSSEADPAASDQPNPQPVPSTQAPTIPLALAVPTPPTAPIQTTAQSQAVAASTDPVSTVQSPRSREPAQAAEFELRRTRSTASDVTTTPSPTTPTADAPSPTTPATAVSATPTSHAANLAPPQPATAPASQTAQPAPPPPAVQVAHAVADTVRVALAAPSTQSAGPHVTTIQLDPYELGRVEIRIERTGDGPAKVELAAERPETLLRLVHDQPQLQQALDQAGIPQQGRTITFSLASNNSSTGFSFTNFAGDSNAGGNGQRPQQGYYGNASGTDSNTTDTLGPAPVWSKAGLDITA